MRLLRLRPLRLTLFALLVPLVLSGCRVFGTQDAQGDLLETLEANRQVWASHGIDSYSFTYLEGLDHTQRGPYDVVVVDGEIDSLSVADEPREPDVETLTVERFFDRIEEVIREDTDQFRMQFNTEYGYPTLLQASYDYRRPQDGVYISTEEFSLPTESE